MSDSYVRAAFQKICNRAIQSSSFYVTLIEEIPFYGGPEEDGWWETDIRIVAFQEFLDKETARKAANRVEKMAKILERRAEREYCKNLDIEVEVDGPIEVEVDGPSKYRVVVGEGIPQESRGTRGYE